LSDNPYQDDRGNKDRSITKAGGGTMKKGHYTGTKSAAQEGEPFLIGDKMTGGYGGGAARIFCTTAPLRWKKARSR